MLWKSVLNLVPNGRWVLLDNLAQSFVVKRLVASPFGKVASNEFPKHNSQLFSVTKCSGRNRTPSLMLRFITRSVEKSSGVYFFTRYTVEMNCSSESSSKKLWNLFQTVHYSLKFKENYLSFFGGFLLVFFFFHNYTGSMQSIKHKSGEEFAYFVCQLQTCARTIYRNSRTWSQKIYLLSPAKVFDFKWKLVRRDERTKEPWAISLRSVCHKI